MAVCVCAGKRKEIEKAEPDSMDSTRVHSNPWILIGGKESKTRYPAFRSRTSSEVCCSHFVKEMFRPALIFGGL